MFTQVEKEKLFIYCMEELRLLIERPYEHDALIERLTAISKNLEALYEHIFIRECAKAMPYHIKHITLHSVPEIAQVLNVITTTTRNYLKKGIRDRQ